MKDVTEQNAREDRLDASLDGFADLDPAQLAALVDYGIETLGDLLGATRGLTDLEGLRAIRADLPVAAVSLRRTLSDDLLDPFTHDREAMPPMGWIPEEPDR